MADFQFIKSVTGPTIISGGVELPRYPNWVFDSSFQVADNPDVPSYTFSVSPLTVNNSGISASVCSNLKNLTGSLNNPIMVAHGYSSSLDGGEGIFYYVSGSTATIDDGIIFGNPSLTGRWYRVGTDEINAKWYGCKGDGVTDDGVLLKRAFTASMTLGKRLFVPSGSYLITTPVSLRPITYNIINNVFASGPKMYGAGIGHTTFIQGCSGAMFDIKSQNDPVVAYRGYLGCELEKFSVRQNSTFVSSSAILLRTVYLTRLSQIHINGNSRMLNGIWVPTNYGDTDASNQMIFEHIRVENCLGWGIKGNADSGVNETSYITMTDVFLQYNGVDRSDTTVNDPPTTGGMIWKGQSLTMRDCCFEINHNVGLFISGSSGLASNATLLNTTFEGNTHRGLFCTGITCFKGLNIQFYNKNEFTASVACEFNGFNNTVRNVDINLAVVRATVSNSNYTAFLLTGTFVEPDSCRIKNAEWNDFDYAGQTRFDGWKFDAVPHNCQLQFVNDQIIRFHPVAGRGGNSVPFRLAGPATGTVPSTTGEWITTTIETNGESIAPTAGSGPEVPGTLLEGGSYAASTTYHCYLWEDDGARKISLSATAPTIDTVSGYWVRTGDVAKYWVGKVTTTSAASPNIRWSHVENAGEGLVGSVTFNPANLLDGTGETTTVTVTGAELGDFARATFSLDLQGIQMTAWVSAADTVSVRFQNETGGPINLDAGILRVKVSKA